MVLHELPRDAGVKIYCDCSDDSKYIVFHHVDGMYSYCITEKGAVVHISAMTPLKPKDDGYEIDIPSEPITDEGTDNSV